MKFATFVVFLAFLFVNTNAVSLKKVHKLSPMDQLQQVGMKSKYAENLFITLSLSMQSGGKVDEVIDFVKKAHVDAQSQRNDLTSNYKTQDAQFTQQIGELEIELRTLNGQLEISLENIDEYGKDVKELETQIARFVKEREGVELRQKALQEANENDIESFKKRQQRDSNTISALEEIIPALESLKESGGSFLEKSQQQIMLNLSRIPNNKSIQKLVQLSSKFNAAKLSEVIVKLGGILESVQQGKAQDEQDQKASLQKFQEISFELESLWHAKQKKINAAKTELAQKQQALRHNLTFRDQITSNIDQSANLKTSTSGLQLKASQTYKKNLVSANEAVEALQAALNILTENEEQLQDQEESSLQDQQA